MAEMKMFVFAVTFIVLFSTLFITIPTDLQGSEVTPNPIIPVNPNVVTDFSDSETFQKSDFIDSTYYWYADALGGYEFECMFITDSFYLAAKSKFFGIWLGAMSTIIFKYENGTSDSGGLSFTEIEDNAVDGVVSFNLVFQDGGTSAGTFLFYWNTTTYGDDPSAAWTGDGLYLLHGVGITTNTDIVSLLLSLLFLQLPDCPILINVLLATPIWASIIFLFWFIIKETLPFV
jgi:predicted secreted protein